MKVLKNGESCMVDYAWDAEKFKVGTYQEMIEKVTGVIHPVIIVKMGEETYLDISGKTAVLYSPSIEPGEYFSWSGEIDKFNEKYPGSIPAKRGYCPPIGGLSCR